MRKIEGRCQLLAWSDDKGFVNGITFKKVFGRKTLLHLYDLLLLIEGTEYYQKNSIDCFLFFSNCSTKNFTRHFTKGVRIITFYYNFYFSV